MNKFLLVVGMILAMSNFGRAQTNQITGTVIPVPELHFLGSPQKDWPVTKIHVKVGDQVKAGDCLIELDPALFPMEKAKAQWEGAQHQIDVIKSRLATRKLTLGRSQRLVKTGATSQQQYDEDTECVKVLEYQLLQAQAECKAAETSFKMAKYDYDNYQRINSLIDGEVIAVNCSPGMIARAEDRQLSWGEVLDYSRVQVLCQVEPKMANQLRELKDKEKTLKIMGTEIEAKILAVPRIIVGGKVSVTLEANNLNLELVCGQEVSIVLP